MFLSIGTVLLLDPNVSETLRHVFEIELAYNSEALLRLTFSIAKINGYFIFITYLVVTLDHNAFSTSRRAVYYIRDL